MGAGNMYAMHQPHAAQENVQRVGQVVVERLDRTVAGIFAAEQAHDVIKNGFDQGCVITGVDAAENAGRLGPNRARVAVGEQAVDLGGCRNVFHVQIVSASRTPSNSLHSIRQYITGYRWYSDKNYRAIFLY